MSSNAGLVVRFSSLWVSFAAAITLSATGFAQEAEDTAGSDDTGETETEGETPPPPAPSMRLDLSVTVPREESDKLLEEDCEEEADAAKIANEIVVCRQLGEATDGSWDKEDWERRYAERTKGRSQPNTFGIANHGNPIGFGKVPPPALLIDVEALPEAPPGSDADRIARGLPPLGKSAELSPDEIAKRRRELGLEAPPVQSEPE